MVIVFDTTALIEVENKNEAFIQEIAPLAEGQDIAITAPTISEYWFGLLKRTLEERKEAEKGLKDYKVLNTSINSSKIHAQIKKELHDNGEMIPEFDILIASIVMDNDAKLLTTDKHFEKVEELDVEIL